jgi:hypothetical protein
MVSVTLRLPGLRIVSQNIAAPGKSRLITGHVVTLPPSVGWLPDLYALVILIRSAVIFRQGERSIALDMTWVR